MIRLFYLGLLISVLGGCYKSPDTSKLSSDFIVVTNFDKAADFTSYKTFVLPTYVGLISSDPKDTVLDPQYGDQILNSIRTHLVARGYTESPNSHVADLGVAATALKEVTVVTGWYPGSWWGYPGWGGCYWYYCGWYPVYPPYYPTYVYTTGSLVVEMVDLKNIPQTEQRLNVIWTNWNGGALGSTSTNLQNALNSVDQAFVQSPYIQTH